MATIMMAPIISESLWGDDSKEQAYYQVCVYKFSGLEQEATFENVWADSADNAIERVAGSNPWLRHNPMAAFKQENGRVE